MATKIVPCNKWVFLKKTEKVVNMGGVYVPEYGAPKLLESEIAVGHDRIVPDGDSFKMASSLGVRVLYTADKTKEVEYNSQKYLLIKEDDIIAELKEVE